jgi:hypothetical protein
LIALAEGRWTAEMVVSGSQIQEGDR